MKIKIYNKQTIGKRETGIAKISVHHLSKFILSRKAIQLLGFQNFNDEHFVELVQDEENKMDWYLMKSTAEKGFRLRKDELNLKFYSTSLAKTILATLPKTDIGTNCRGASFPIAPQPIEIEGMELWPLITAAFKK